MEKGNGCAMTDKQGDIAPKGSKMTPKTAEPFFITAKNRNYENGTKNTSCNIRES